MTDELNKDLEKEIERINKEYKTEGMSFLEGEHTKPNEVISTGILGLDLAVGHGGLATGSIVEIYGPESGGKTSIALFCIAEAQKLGHGCAFLDMEHALDLNLARVYGVDTKKLIFDQPDSGEECLGKAEMLVEGGKVKVIVLDSVDALVPRSILEGSFEDSNMGKQAKMMSQAMRKLNGLVAKNNVLFIFINQIRMKIGVVYGNPETTSGGNALKFYAKYRLDVRSKEKIKDKDLIIGAETCVKVKKNKKAPPFREATFTLIYGKGIDKEQEVASVALALGIIAKSGSWMYLGEEKIGQGTTSIVERCKQDIEFKQELERIVYANTVISTPSA